ncbi:lysylphosphatidylglycerol synthase transmembrane domain-containing protein [Streptomyces sp. NPDC001537]
MSLLPLDDAPGRLPTAIPSPTPSPVRFRTPRLLRSALVVLPLLLLGVWAAVDWRTVYDGTVRLGSADPWWLLVALLFTCLGWLSAPCIRQGALPERLPAGLLIASQFAAGAANHVLPASIGAHAVTLRFLQRRGIPLARATASLALYSAVKPIARTLVLLVFLAAFPGVLLTDRLVPDRRTSLLVAGAVALALIATALLVTTVRPLRRPLLDALRCALTDVRLLHTRPARVLALWGGSAAAPLIQASVLFAVGAALGLSLSWLQVAFAFLAANTAVGAVPAPGGIGPVDAAVVFAMVALGAPVNLSATAVIGYRVLTVWLPLLPGALVLSALVQRKVL